MTDELGDILGREQVLKAAWLLPNEGTLSDAQRRQAMENFAGYIRRHGLKPTDVARQIGKPKATTIGELTKHVWREGSDDHIRRLNLWVEQHARAHAASLTDRFVSTKVANDMLTVARLVRENGTMGIVYGPTGIGKSRCAQAIHEKYVGSVYVSIVPGPGGSHSAKGLIRALATKLGVRDYRVALCDGAHATQLERVLETLRGSARLLIVDEASYLTDEAIETLRCLHDQTGCPVLLVATRELHDRIVQSADPDRGQLYSRFDITHRLVEGHDVLAGGGNRPLYTLDDIRALYNQPPIRLAPDAERYLQDVANDLGHGSLRRCAILLRNAARRARKRQDLPDDEPVTVAAADLEWVDTRFRREASEQEAVADRRRRTATAASA